MEEYCSSCFIFFKTIESCPRSLIFQKGELYEMFLEVIWVLSSVLPVLVFSALVLHSFFKRTSRGVFLFGSLILQQIIVALLKKYFAQARPKGACSSSFGYPSGHSCFAAGLVTWLFLEVVILHDKIPFKSPRFYSMTRNFCLCFAPLIPISRYFLNYHSPEQILYGLITGLTCTILLFGVLMAIMMHQSHGRFYHSVVSKIWKKFKFHDNFLHHHHYVDEVKDDATDEEKTIELKKHLHIHPFRENIRYFFEKYVARVSLMHEEKEDDELQPF